MKRPPDLDARAAAKPGSIGAMLRRVAPYLLRHKAIAAANVLCAALALACALAFPQIIQYIIDDVITRGQINLLLPSVVLLLAAFLLRGLFTALRIIANNTFEQNVIYDMRCDLYARLQVLPIRYFDQRASGDLMTRLGDDVVAVERIIIDGSEQGILALLSVVVVFAVLLLKNAELALLALVPLPLLVLAVVSYSVVSVRQFRLLRHAIGALNSLLADNLQGIRQIKLFNLQQQEHARFAGRAATLRRRSLVVLMSWAAYAPSITFFASLGTVLTLWRGGAMVTAGQITLGELVGFLFYLGLFYEPIGQLQRLNQTLQAARAASERIADIAEAAPERAGRRPDAVLPAPVRGEVRFEDVRFGYGPGRDVLKDISLHARPGETVALVGESGAGKSTLVNLLPAFHEPNRGRITIDARDIRQLSLESLRAEIAVVTQETFLFNGTVRENLLYGKPGASETEIMAACRAANCDEFISHLPQGGDTEVGERGVRLSVGEKQRISVARALLKNAPILILDEATASVDNATEALIQEALERLMVDRTCFVIAHRLSTIEHADQILVMSEGTIVERGTHRELLALGGAYSRLRRRPDGEPAERQSGDPRPMLQ